jgi:hypothetical protein
MENIKVQLGFHLKQLNAKKRKTKLFAAYLFTRFDVFK